MNVDGTEVRKISNKAIASTDYYRSKRTGECAIFEMFGKQKNKKQKCKIYVGSKEDIPT